ncbi:hypothetical protein L3Q82_003284 [Scortum barcoo]|uniref:Uncharacterized protein n=1 Tax=Scortum barcoo TaxID=214431 RepID=A0ACB8VME8_9TELE|nr:hypothetical protein L3Q82_003284 [Scortum barcoo]
MFKLAVDAAKKASGYAKSKYRYDRPSLAVKLGHSLKTVGDILIGQFVQAEDEAAANRVRSFMGLVNSEWNHYVSHRARTNLEENKWNKKDMIPLTEDVFELQKYLKCVEQNAREKLIEGPDAKAYNMLSETLLSQIILFNRRRQGEAAKMLLETYETKNTETLNEDVMQCLSKLERDLSHDFTRIVIRGKRGRKVPVLLTKEMTTSLDFLIEHRMEENGILDTNKTSVSNGAVCDSSWEGNGSYSEARSEGLIKMSLVIQTKTVKSYSKTRSRSPDSDEPCDADEDSDKGPDTDRKTKVKRSSKTKRNELFTSKKKRPNPDEPCDSDQDSDTTAEKMR